MSAAKVGLNGRSNEALPLIVAWLTGWTAMILVDETVSMPGPTKWGGALVAVVTVLLLGLYYYARRERLNIDRAGDALYYLGLLLTLGSLIWSLASLTVHGEGENDLSAQANEIIGNFGIALVSTVAGIVGRISLQSLAGQNQQTPAEKDVQYRKTSASAQNGTQIHAMAVNRDLNLMAQHLRRQMQEAADAFSAFNRTTMQEAEATRSAAQRHTEDVRKRLEEMAQATIKTVEEAHREMVGRLRETGEALEQRTEAADKVARAMLNQAAATREKVEAVTTCMERERLGLEGIGEAIRREVGAAAEVLGELSENVTRTNEAIDRLQDTVIRAGKALKEMAEEAQHSHETLRKDAEERERGLVRQFQQNRRDIDQEIRVWSDHVEHAARALKTPSEGSESLEQIVGRMRTSCEQLAALAETLNVAETSISTLGQAAEAMARKVEQQRAEDASQRPRGVISRLLGRK